MSQLPLDPHHFLAEYWQQQPLFIPRAVKNFTPPLSRHELAGLALESEIESRIVVCRDGDWQVQHGPFSEADFQRSYPWSLLVQAVDHHVPAVMALHSLVDFIPGWRIDDVMVSYGVDGASVGPHYDNYDVFLLQGEGEKLWRLGQRCDSATALLPHDDLRILQDFKVQKEFLLTAGDILYVPPGVAHWGIAKGDSTTFSIGFRAPRLNDMLSRFTDEALELINPELFFKDAQRTPGTLTGEIAPEDIARAKAQIISVLEALDDSGDWLGELVTEPRDALALSSEEYASQAAALNQPDSALCMEAGARLAWAKTSRGITAFANGLSHDITAPELHYLEILWRAKRLGDAGVSALRKEPNGNALLNFLLETGCVYVE